MDSSLGPARHCEPHAPKNLDIVSTPFTHCQGLVRTFEKTRNMSFLAILRRLSGIPAPQRCVIFFTTHPSTKSFRINTYKTLSKQMTLTCLRIHTYKKGQGEGVTRTPTRLSKNR